MENIEEKLAVMFKGRLSAWKKGQAGQTSGYEYERSFAEMMRGIGEAAFKEAAGTGLSSKNKKNCGNGIWEV